MSNENVKDKPNFDHSPTTIQQEILMSDNFEEIRHDISHYAKELKTLAPEAMGHFYQLSHEASKDGLLSAKTKEFVALAIGVATHCDGCIAFHTKTLKKLGATREEIGEILAMNVYMGGGPSLMYAAKALKAFDQLQEPST